MFLETNKNILKVSEGGFAPPPQKLNDFEILKLDCAIWWTLLSEIWVQNLVNFLTCQMFNIEAERFWNFETAFVRFGGYFLHESFGTKSGQY